MALLITQSLQEKYLPSKKEQFQLVKRLRDALVLGSGLKLGYLGMAKTLETLID